MKKAKELQAQAEEKLKKAKELKAKQAAAKKSLAQSQEAAKTTEAHNEKK